MHKKLTFLNIEPTERLEFEELSAGNFLQLVTVFQEDSNLFIQEGYKNAESARKYYEGYNYFRHHSSQTSNCDWLFKLKSTGAYVGLLNLYDLNFDKNSNYHKMCSIGYATGEKYRRKGLTKEAVLALIKYTFTELNLESIMASTMNDNIASRLFLQSISFSANTKDYENNIKNKYFELKKS